MKITENRILWEQFIEKYKVHFKTNDNIWNEKLDKVKKYINDTNKCPNKRDKNINTKQLGEWICKQKINYKTKNEYLRIPENRFKWEEFIQEYKNYIKTPDEKWDDLLDKVKKYINNNKKFPNKNKQNNNIHQLWQWVNYQQLNYGKKRYNMKLQENITKWEQFIEEYKQYL